MSLLAKHDVPFFVFFKKSISFFFTKTFADVMRAPLALLLVVCFLGMNVLNEQMFEGTPIISVNFGFLLSFLVAFSVVCISTMVETQRRFFHISLTSKNLFGLRFGKTEIKYMLLFVAALLCGILVTVFWAVMLYAASIYFFKVVIPVKFLAWVTFGVSPYFTIRFAAVFPAVVVGDKVSLYRAWRMSHGLASSLCLYYVFAAIVPMLAGGVLSVGITFLEQIGFPAMMIAVLSLYISTLCILLSCISQSVFMSEFYACLKERKMTDGFDDSFIFSIAKKKE